MVKHTPHPSDTAVSLVPSAEVAVLRCRSAVSGYRNVYESGRHYVAKVKIRGILRIIPGSRHSQPHVVARHVVNWYKKRFGANWLAAISRRKRRYWVVRKVGGKFALTVWLSGQESDICLGGVTRTFKTAKRAWRFLRQRLLRTRHAAAWRGD